MRPSGTFWARMSQPIPAFKLDLPAHERSGCARDLNRFNSAPAILNSVVDKKSVFVKLEVCKVPVIAVCDTGASVSCIIQQLFGQLPVTFSTELQTAHRRLLAANQGEIPVLGTVTLSISFASNRYQQQFFVLKTSEADCLLGSDFLEDHQCYALFSSMQFRLPNPKIVPLFHSREVFSVPPTDFVRVIGLETTFRPAGQEAFVLGALITQRFPAKAEGIFEPSPAFCEKCQLLAFSSPCEPGETIPAHLINSVEDVRVYKGTTLRNFSLVGSKELAAMNRVIADLPDCPQGQVLDKFDIKEVLIQTQSSMNPNILEKFAKLLRTFSDVFSESKWDVGRCDLVKQRIDLYPGSKPVKLPNRRMPMHFKVDLRQNVDKFLEHKLITPCQSLHRSPAVLVPKKKSNFSLVIDCRLLNN